MQRSPSLAELQRWLRWALTHPLGVHRAAAGEHLPGLPARFIEPDARALSFIAGDLGGRDAAERLSVHGTGYFARLHGTLRLEYPRLAGALGEDEFRVLIRCLCNCHSCHSIRIRDLEAASRTSLSSSSSLAICFRLRRRSCSHSSDSS